jgi:hypothetical protein
LRDIPSVYAGCEQKKKVVFCMPINRGQAPHPRTIESLEATIPLLIERGWEEGYTETRGNPYISGARAELTRKALDAKPSHIFYLDIFYLDYDLSWKPEDLLKVLEAEGDVVAGTYRVKTDDPDEVLYMGAIFSDANHLPVVRQSDGALAAKVVPAGFLRLTVNAVDTFMRAYPKLCFGPQFALSVDLFNHGAHEGIWWGEDYAFSRNYRDAGGDIWIVPDLDLDHHSHWEEGRVYKGNFHEYLLAQPGGSNDPARLARA